MLWDPVGDDNAEEQLMTVPGSSIELVVPTDELVAAAQSLDGTIRVGTIAQPRLDAGLPTYDVIPVEPFTKRYGLPPDELRDAIAHTQGSAILARSGDRVVGRLRISEHWNRYAWIEDLVVDAGSRRLGAGRALMAWAEGWARSRGLPGIMLETQNVNVAACRFYERCGFVLGGFDQWLYRGFDPDTIEVAFFWYRDLRGKTVLHEPAM